MKIDFGFGVSGASGSFGGVTASRNKGGAYLRRKGNPTNPNTTGQQIQRGLLANQVAAYRGLTPGEQRAWEVAAESGQFNRTDKLGKSRPLSAAQLYTSLNLALTASGFAAITEPPSTLPTVPNLVLDPVAVSAAEGVQVIMTGNAATGIPAGAKLNVYATGPLGGGILRPGAGTYRKIASLVAGDFTTTTADVSSEYEAFFNRMPLASENVAIKIEYIFDGVGVKYPAGGDVWRYVEIS